MHFYPAQNIHIISLGCTKNLVDSEVMLGRLKHYTITQDIEAADVIIINTCGFIESAKQESIQTILEAAHKRKSGALLIVSGCLSERYSAELSAEIPEIDIITGVGDYDKIDKMIANAIKMCTDFTKSNNLENPPKHYLQSFLSRNVFLANEQNERVIIGSHFHSYIKLSEGCNQQCSFCAIPQFKGKLHSRTLASTLKELENLYERGFRDFSFIAQDSSSYMHDLGQKDGLVSLIQAIDSLGLDITCRIFYLYPSTTTIELIESIASSKCFLPYFDMPIQHIADSMLKIMRRGADKAYHIALLEAMRAVKNSFIRTSFVIGHPHEEEAEFRELCAFIESFVFDRVNLFAYSPQERTPAYKLPHPSSKITNARINALNKILKKQYKQSLQALVGQETDVIIEGKSEMSAHFYKARDVLWGREIDGEILINDSAICDKNGAPIPLKEGYYRAKITSYKQNMLFGKILYKNGA